MELFTKYGRMILWLAALGLAIILTGKVVDQVRSNVVH